MLVPSKELEFNADGESLIPLFENEWVRMLLIRNQNSEGQATIEVELSIPHEYSELGDEDAYSLLETALLYLRFMKHLCERGFKLQLVDRDWLWTASIEFDLSKNEDDVLETLVYPRTLEEY